LYIFQLPAITGVRELAKGILVLLRSSTEAEMEVRDAVVARR
jgi:hypothetical protein